MEQIRQKGIEFVISDGTHRLHGVLPFSEIENLTPEEVEALKQQKFQQHLAALTILAQ
jgi:hypothetical protein